MLEKVARGLRRFVADEQGLETVEYAIIGGLIVAGTVATIILVRQALIARFNAIKQAISTSGSSSGGPVLPAGPSSG